MKMKDVCHRTGLAKRTIHYYINEKLIQPSSNSTNNYYEFCEQDCQQLILIRELRNANVSIPAIRSILKTPSTANYYFSKHIQKLKKEKRQIEQVLSSMKYMLDELPLFPDFPSLYNLCIEANIPSPLEIKDAMEETYNVVYINQYLWGAFLPKQKFTDYQEFLWMKLNKITFENPSPEYKQFGEVLYNLPSNQIDLLFSIQSDQYAYIASLNEEQMDTCLKDTIHRLDVVANSVKYQHLWKSLYNEYFHPIVSIQASSLSNLVMELSPFYKDYVTNIHILCQRTYDYLHTPSGESLRKTLQKNLFNCIDMESNYHGELEALASLFEFHDLVNG